MSVSELPEICLWPVDGLTRVFPDTPPPRNAAEQLRRGWQIVCARNEYRTLQLGIDYDGSLAALSVEVEDLRCGSRSIPAKGFKVRWVGLMPVALDRFKASDAERPDYAPGFYPDPLLESIPWRNNLPGRDNILARSAAVHLTLFVPARTKPGTYRGKVIVRHEKRVVARVPLQVRVWPFAIPKHSSFYVANWVNQDAITLWYRCEPWSARHWRIIEAYAQDMAAYRQNTIITPAFTGFMGNVGHRDTVKLVDITREKDGTCTLDMSRLERWVKLHLKYGFKLFELWHFAMPKTGARAPAFWLFDKALNKKVYYDKLSTNGKVYRDIVGQFLSTLSAWLDERGWAERFLIHVFDEPRVEYSPQYLKLSRFFRRQAPKFKQIDAMGTSRLITEYGAEIDIPVPNPVYVAGESYYQERARAGKEMLWSYTAGGGRGNADRVIYMPLVSTRILHWQYFSNSLGGYLHWGYNFWFDRRVEDRAGTGIPLPVYEPLNPYSEHTAFYPTGDAWVVYPPPNWWEDVGPVSSLRYEAMREGLQDYEMLVMLAKLCRDDKVGANARRRKVLAKARRLLAMVRGPMAGDLTGFSRDAKLLLRTHDRLGDCISALME